jgi:hypothetical protein
VTRSRWLFGRDATLARLRAGLSAASLALAAEADGGEGGGAAAAPADVPGAPPEGSAGAVATQSWSEPLATRNA